MYLEFGCNVFLEVKLQLFYSIVCLTFINVQKQILKNPVFKSTFVLDVYQYMIYTNSDN